MPLFIFECSKCQTVVEKLIKADDDKEILCEKCGEKCNKKLSICCNRTELDSRTLYNDKILPDVKKISSDLNSGKDEAFFDICGEK